MTKLATHQLSADDFLIRFFALPNKIPLSQVSTPDGKWKHLQSWVEDIRHDPPRASVLPCWRNDRTYWYGVAFSYAQLSALREDLMAFVGPTYSSFRGHRTVLDASDPIDAVVLALTSGLAFKFTGPVQADEAKAIWTALELMRAVASQRPQRDLQAPRPSGRVLRDFYMALRAGNAVSADSNLRYLLERNRLDPINILFLRVQMLAELGDWQALVARPEVPDLLQMRRPVAVTEALMRAVYHVELEQFERTTDIDAAINRFRSSVMPKYGALFTRRAGIQAPAALKALMLLAVANEPANLDLRDSVLGTAGLSEEDRGFLNSLAARESAPSVVRPADLLTAAVEAATHGDYDRVFAFALQAPPTVTRARLLLECAYELQTLETQRSAVAAVETLSDEDRTAVLHGRHHREMYEHLVGRSPTVVAAPRAAEEIIPSDWLGWLGRVEGDPGWERALDIARSGSIEWRVEGLTEASGSVQRLARRLTDLGGLGVVQDALPHLLAFLQRDEAWPRRELVPVYRSMLEVLAIGSTGSEDDLTESYVLMQAVIGFGANEQEYAEVVEQVRYLLTKVESLARVVWGLDVIDLMVVYPCPRTDLRIGVLSDVGALFQRYWRRIEAGQWDIFRALCGDLGHPDVFTSLVSANTAPITGAEGLAPDVLESLREKLIGIYTLTESVGRRVRDLLTRRVPGVRVEVSNDKVASERLRHLARNADIMIVVTASAKHAASEFIDAQRHNDDPRRPTLRPTGKGSASVLQALYAHLLRSLSG